MMVAKGEIYYKKIMLLPVLTDNHPLLRQKAKPATIINASTKKLIKDMLDTMNYGQRAVGLAAPQVGISERIIVCKISNSHGRQEDMAFINPEIITKSPNCEIGEEGCLSIPNIFGPVNRPKEITMQFMTIDRKTVIKRFTGFNARVIQHEIDHLNGILFTDLVSNPEELFEEINF